MCNPSPRDTLWRGVYIDARTTGHGREHDRLVALALLAFSFDDDARIVDIATADALHWAGAGPGAGGDAPAPGIDLVAANACIERADLLVTHTRGFSRALLKQLIAGAREPLWLELEIVAPAPEESVHLHGGASHGVEGCMLGVWLLAQMPADARGSMLALMLARAERGGATMARAAGELRWH